MDLVIVEAPSITINEVVPRSKDVDILVKNEIPILDFNVTK